MYDTRLLLYILSFVVGMVVGGDNRNMRDDYAFTWAKTLSGPEEGDVALDILLDHQGNVYVAGSHSGLDLDRDGVIDFPAMPCGVCPRGSADPFIMKTTADGDLLWIQSPDGPGFEEAESAALAMDGGVYIIGSFPEVLHFATDTTLRTKGESDGYLASYEPSGSIRWARSVGGPGIDKLMDVATGSDGRIYVTGIIEGDADLDGDGRIDAATTGKQGPVVMCYTPAGTLLWAKVFQSKSPAFGWKIAVRGDRIAVAGSYQRQGLDCNGDQIADVPEAQGGADAFIAWLDTSGEFQKAIALSGKGFEIINDIGFVFDGDVLVAGTINAPTKFALDGALQPLPKGLEHAGFVARYASDGVLKWVKTAGAEMLWHVTSSADMLIVSGLFKGDLDFNLDGIIDAYGHSDGKSEGFVALTDLQGDLLELMSITGPDDDQCRASAMSIDQKILYTAGFIRLSADFDGDGHVEGGIRCDARGDIFVARYE